jgi:CD109 antigen
LTQEPSKLTVFRPFFIGTNLPYSVKRTEVVAIPIQVFNYQNEAQEVEVILYNENEEFEFAEVDADQALVSNTETEKFKYVTVEAQSAATVSFLIRPLKAGQITIKVVATADSAGDGLEKQLIVEPEGVTQFMNKAILIDLTKNRNFQSTISIAVPSNAVPDSTKIEASAIGDVLGPTFDNLGNLL